MKRITVVILALAVLPMLTLGCTKKVQLTIVNHAETARDIQVTTPEETLTLGSVGPNGGSLTGMIAIKSSDLPAQVRISAGAGANASFMVTEDTADRVWFHISRTGALSGPYNKRDVHVETEQDATITVKSEGTMVVK